MQFEQGQQNSTMDPRGIIFPGQLGCELVLVGNPYMWIGAIFYINAKLISHGHATASFLRYGGYYAVDKVENYIKEGAWETRIMGKILMADETAEVISNAEVVTPLSADERYEKMLEGGMSPQAANAALLKEMKTNPAS